VTQSRFESWSFRGLVMDTCHCLASRVRVALDEQRYELDGGRHTKFMVFRCRECGKYKGFPQDNMDLFLVSGSSEDVEAFVKKLDAELEEK